MDLPAPTGYTLHDRIDGVTQSRGKSAGIELNYAYTATSTDGTKCVLMYCNPGHYTIIDNTETLDKIRKYNDKTITWFIMKCGYAAAHITENDKSTCIYLHQLLLNHRGNGKGQLSVDHINTHKLDNRLCNIRLASQSIQNANRRKVSRHKNARQLPDGISADMIPKFVVYYKENVSNTTREFFTVEGHPLQISKEAGIENDATNKLTARRWSTTKSSKCTIQDKLKHAVQYVSELDKLLADNTYIITIPKFVKPIREQPKVEDKSAQSIKELQTKAPPKQWKVLQIYNCIKANAYEPYKVWCEETNELAGAEWDTTFTQLLTDVRATTSLETAEPIIRTFIQELRRIRHNKLTAKVVSHEDRQQWPANTILKAFRNGEIATFKKWLKEQDGELTDADKVRWDSLIEHLEDDDTTDKEKQATISKFLTARRARKYRASNS